MMVTFAVWPRKRVPHDEMEGDVPTESTGGRFTNSNSRVSFTQFPSESHTSRVMAWPPSERKHGGPSLEFAMKNELLLDWRSHAGPMSPSMLLVQLYVSESKSKSQLSRASKTILLSLEYSVSSNGVSHRMNGGWLLSSNLQ